MHNKRQSRWKIKIDSAVLTNLDTIVTLNVLLYFTRCKLNAIFLNKSWKENIG